MKLRITIAGKTYEVDVEVLEDEEGLLPPAQPGYVPAPLYMAPEVAAGAAAAAQNPDGSETICRSPVTGLVIRVNAEAGQTVEANQLLLVLEAMKMETQVTAPRAGVVEKVHVTPGNSVKAGQVLVELRED